MLEVQARLLKDDEVIVPDLVVWIDWAEELGRLPAPHGKFHSPPEFFVRVGDVLCLEIIDQRTDFPAYLSGNIVITSDSGVGDVTFRYKPSPTRSP